jgi:hypothetical protein
MLRIPHFLDNRLIDGDKIVSFTRRPPFTPKNIPRIFLVHKILVQKLNIFFNYSSALDTLEQTPWLLVRKRTIPTERPPLVGEVSANFSE